MQNTCAVAFRIIRVQKRVAIHIVCAVMVKQRKTDRAAARRQGQSIGGGSRFKSSASAGRGKGKGKGGNAFERFANHRRHHTILGARIKGEERRVGAARSAAVEKVRFLAEEEEEEGDDEDEDDEEKEETALSFSAQSCRVWTARAACPECAAESGHGRRCGGAAARAGKVGETVTTVLLTIV